MNKQLISTLQTEFNQLSNTLENSSVEYWFARDLQEVSGHFRDVTKMVSIGSKLLIQSTLKSDQKSNYKSNQKSGHWEIKE